MVECEPLIGLFPTSPRVTLEQWEGLYSYGNGLQDEAVEVGTRLQTV